MCPPVVQAGQAVRLSLGHGREKRVNGKEEVRESHYFPVSLLKPLNPKADPMARIWVSVHVDDLLNISSFFLMWNLFQIYGLMYY